MEIIIDNREHELIRLINIIKEDKKYTEISIKTKELDIGDILICKDNTVLNIIERKTINDLLASIKDGRYNEQSFRLNEVNIHNHNIIYLIEGKILKDKNIIFSSMFSIAMYKGFSLVRTDNVEDTAFFIINSALKILKNKKKNFFYEKVDEKVDDIVVDNVDDNVDDIDDEKVDIVVDDDKVDIVIDDDKVDIVVDDDKVDKCIDIDYLKTISKKPRSMITNNNIHHIMLMQVPHVNNITAISILNTYKTIDVLIQSLKINKDCLKDIKTTNNRKISKLSIESIKNLLL